MPCLHDRYEEGGATKREYFWQELLVARAIYAAKPVTHVDIGSRVDSIVAHVASFREIEVMDVRPSTTAIPGIGFRQLDLMDSATLPIAPLGGGGDTVILSLLLACVGTLWPGALWRPGQSARLPTRRRQHAHPFATVRSILPFHTPWPGAGGI